MRFNISRKPKKSVNAASGDRVPIFIISCNRLQSLQETIGSYKKNIGTPFEIVIHDNNSTYKPLLDYLGKLENEGV